MRKRLEKPNDPSGGGTRRGHPRIMPLGFGRGTFFQIPIIKKRS
jgi:hypothetical protein